MPRLNCLTCNQPIYYSPSHVPKRSFCSRKCYSKVRDEELTKNGVKTRLTGKEYYKKTYHYGTEHYAWKGEQASYRALHYWLRRNRGKPIKCLHCGRTDERPRFIQWANIDGKYRRVLTDYIPLCVSCHKIHDLKIKASLGGRASKK